MKKAVVFVFSLVALLMVQVGSASAETPLNKTIADLIGTPYKWAGTTTAGFDCSGFTSYVFSQLGIDLPHSSKEQDAKGFWVEKSALRAGDLVFFNTDGKGVSHVGIYVGDGYFVHSATDKGVIKSALDESYYKKRYVAARRVMWDEMYTQLTTDAK